MGMRYNFSFEIHASVENALRLVVELTNTDFYVDSVNPCSTPNYVSGVDYECYVKEKNKMYIHFLNVTEIDTTNTENYTFTMAFYFPKKMSTTDINFYTMPEFS